MRVAPALRVALAVLFADMVGQSLVFPSLPTLLQELGGMSPQRAALVYGWMAGGYALAELFSAPVIGMLSDRFGRKPLLALGAFGSGASFLVSALAPNVPVLAAGYVLAGLTSALLVVVRATVADTTEPENRPAAFGYVGAVFGIGFTLGPALGALLAPLGLRAPFFASAAIMLVAGTLVLTLMPESRRPQTDPVALRDVLPWKGLRELGRVPIVASLAWTIGLSGFALQVLIGAWVPFASLRFGLGVQGNGLLLAAVGISSAIGQAVVVPRLVPKLGVRRSILVGLSVSVATYLGYAFAPNLAVFGVVLVVGALAAVDEPAIDTVVSEAVDEDLQGTIQGAVASIGSFMGIVGPIAGTSLLAFTTGSHAAFTFPGSPFFAGAVASAVGLVLAVRTLRRFPLPATLVGMAAKTSAESGAKPAADP